MPGLRGGGAGQASFLALDVVVREPQPFLQRSDTDVVGRNLGVEGHQNIAVVLIGPNLILQEAESRLLLNSGQGLLDLLQGVRRLAVQAVAHGTRHIVDTLNEAGYQIDTLFACGGGTKNPVFLREHADISGCRLVLPREPEAVLLGSAILGAVAAGDGVDDFLVGVAGEVSAQATDVECFKCVDTGDIAPAAVTSGKLRTQAVTSTKIRDYAVTTNKIKGQSVTTGKIANGAIGTRRSIATATVPRLARRLLSCSTPEPLQRSTMSRPSRRPPRPGGR